RTEVRFGAGYDDVRICGLSVQDGSSSAAVLRVEAGVTAADRADSHAGMAERVDALGDGVDVVFEQLARCLHDLVDRGEGGVHRAGADRGLNAQTSVRTTQAYGGRRHAVRATGDLHRVEREVLDAATGLGRRERLQIGVGDGLLLVGQALEALESGFQRFTFQRVTELFQAHGEGVAARVLAHDEQRFARADRLGTHDFVGAGVFEHAVLVNARFVRKGVGADDRLVRLHDHAGAHADQAAGADQLRGVDAGAQTEHGLTRLQRHHDLFERGVASAFADAVDRDFGLARTGHDAGQGVGSREAQVVVAVHG